MTIQKLRPSFTFTQDRLEELQAVIPEAFADGRIDWDVLKEALGAFLEDEGPNAEHFGLFWPGKRDARRLAAAPSKGTLKPVPSEGVHEDATGNIFIEGDNLEVLKLLQKSYAGRIKMIYIDPPYNTGNDFVYKDDFRDPLEDYLRKTGQADEEGKVLTTNTKADGRFHSNWLSMMYPRLRLARTLLRDDGAIFVSIDDTEMAHLKLSMSEIFGEENFVATLVWQRSKKGDAKLIANIHEYILIFCKDKNSVIQAGLWRRKKAGAEEVLAHYEQVKTLFNGNHAAISSAMRAWYNSLSKEDPRRSHAHYYWSDDRGLYFADNFAGPDDGRVSRPRYDILHPITGKPCKKPSTGWRWDEERTKKALAAEPPLIHFGPDETTIPCRKSYLFEIDSEPFMSVFYRDGRAATLELEKLVGPSLIDFPKNSDVMRELIELVTDSSSLVLDFFAGSCTTAQAVLELNHEDGGNRHFMCVQLPEQTPATSAAHKAGYDTIAQIGKERIRRVIANMQQITQSELLKHDHDGSEDLGFKVFKLSHSNFKAWQDYQGEDVQELETLFDGIETPLIAGWSEAGLLIEILLLQGFPLDSTITRVDEFKQNNIQMIDSDAYAHRLFVCLDERINDDTITQLQLRSEDAFVCLDSALTDQSKMRLGDVCNLNII